MGGQKPKRGAKNQKGGAHFKNTKLDVCSNRGGQTLNGGSGTTGSPLATTLQAILLGCKGYFSQISLHLPQKLSCDKLSPYKFSVAVGTLYFPLPSCHRLEN